MTKFNDILNSDLLNKFLDKKLKDFSLFLVCDDEKNNYCLVFNDKKASTEIKIAEFKTYNQYLRWLTEAALMRVASDAAAVKKIRSIYNKLYSFSRDPSRKDSFQDD